MAIHISPKERSMSDDQPTHIERAIARAFRPQRRLSRRGFLRDAGRGAVITGSALSLPAILAACGIKPQASSTAGGSTAAQVTPRPLPSKPAGTLNFANWPAYIDIDEESGGYPTLEKFTKESGIKVNYTEEINDNEEYFGEIQPDLQAGNPIGPDLIVLTDWMIQRMIRLGYLDALDKSQLTNFEANVQDLYKDPWYDPGNTFSAAWQSGITGIGYNKKLTKREITTFDDLLDPAFKGVTGLFSEMRDTLSLAIGSLGKDPTTATADDARAAAAKLKEAAERDQFRNFYGNEYYDELANGNLALTIAWSGDVSQMKLYDNADVEFVVPASGGMLWVDNMCLPKNSAHPLDAHMMIDFWYKLENAVPLTEYIGYFSPVNGVVEQVQQDAKDAKKDDPEWAAALKVIADTAVPSDEALANVHTYKQLGEAEEREWNDAFDEVVAG
jgi:spermidine/putrescine transport system substrate-binding protein